MTLVVETPVGYEPERDYIAGVVLGDWLGLDWRRDSGRSRDVRIGLEGDATGRCVLMPDVLFGTPAEDWLAPASLPSSPLVRREGLPVIYGTRAPGDWLTRCDGDVVQLAVDVLGSAFFMLARLEELGVAVRDAHGRFPAVASLAHREGFLGLPVVDAYVELLWGALARLWPGLERRPRRFRVVLTHDVDDPLASLGRTPLQLARQLGADALVRRDAGLAARRLRSWVDATRGDHRRDPYNTFDFLMDVSERNGLVSAFNLMAADGTPAAENPPYTLEHPSIGELIARIHRRGHEIGFHAIDLDPERTARGFERVRAAARRNGVEQEVWGGRQHYLRWENPSTWAAWDRAGLDYDATLAFADRIGFRAGTCHEFRVFDAVARRPLRLRERPFQVMDRTLSEYMGLSADAALRAVEQIARECRRQAGTLMLLWHNNVVVSAAQKREYERLVRTVAGPP